MEQAKMGGRGKHGGKPGGGGGKQGQNEEKQAANGGKWGESRGKQGWGERGKMGLGRSGCSTGCTRRITRYIPALHR